MNSIYKVMIDQITDSFESAGKGVLCEDFYSLKDAISAYEEYRLSPLSAVEIREYSLSENQIISFSENDTGKMIYSDRPLKESYIELVDAVISEYEKDSTEMSEMFLDGIYVKMSKADVLVAWKEIQEMCNGDIVVRLDSFGNEALNLVPKNWGSDIVTGNAMDILLEIDKEKNNGGPIFARIMDEDEPYLSLVFGEFEFDFSDKQDEKDEIER